VGRYDEGRGFSRALSFIGLSLYRQTTTSLPVGSPNPLNPVVGVQPGGTGKQAFCVQAIWPEATGAGRAGRRV